MQTENKTYKTLLENECWKIKRLEIIQKDGGKCVCCHSEKQLEVHHRQYHKKNNTGELIPPWKYENNYLISLCNNCHQMGHSKYKVPVFEI